MKLEEYLPYFFYKTTNLVNENYYFGVHKGSGEYLGSGTVLKRAVKKYGKENFKLEILKRFKTGEVAYRYEKKIVTPELISDPKCYNLVPGGQGGWKFSQQGRKITPETRAKISKTLSGRSLTSEHRTNISVKLKETLQKRKVKPLSVKQKQKISKQLHRWIENFVKTL